MSSSTPVPVLAEFTSSAYVKFHREVQYFVAESYPDLSEVMKGRLPLHIISKEPSTQHANNIAYDVNTFKSSDKGNEEVISLSEAYHSRYMTQMAKVLKENPSIEIIPVKTESTKRRADFASLSSLLTSKKLPKISQEDLDGIVRYNLFDDSLVKEYSNFYDQVRRFLSRIEVNASASVQATLNENALISESRQNCDIIRWMSTVKTLCMTAAGNSDLSLEDAKRTLLSIKMSGSNYDEFLKAFKDAMQVVQQLDTNKSVSEALICEYFLTGLNHAYVSPKGNLYARWLDPTDSYWYKLMPFSALNAAVTQQIVTVARPFHGRNWKPLSSDSKSPKGGVKQQPIAPSNSNSAPSSSEMVIQQQLDQMQSNYRKLEKQFEHNNKKLLTANAKIDNQRSNLKQFYKDRNGAGNSAGNSAGNKRPSDNDGELTLENMNKHKRNDSAGSGKGRNNNSNNNKNGDSEDARSLASTTSTSSQSNNKMTLQSFCQTWRINRVCRDKGCKKVHDFKLWEEFNKSSL